MELFETSQPPFGSYQPVRQRARKSFGRSRAPYLL